jgi:hypothetical protein
MTRTSIASLVALIVAQGIAAASGVIPDVGKKASVCLQTSMGTFVCAEGGGGGLVVVNRAEAKGWETFELNRVDADHVTLKASNGQYLCAEGGGGMFVVANRKEAKAWETFAIYIDNNGLVALAASNGKFLCAEPSGHLAANRETPKEWEAFRIVDPSDANGEQTQIVVNVYKIATAPLWHTGTVIDGREYYFQTNNKVETCKPQGMALKHHRTMVRLVPGNLERVKKIRDQVISRWDGTRYDVAGHNCNFFTNDLLQSLGAPGLDQEYLDASGLAKGLRQAPGGAMLSELVVKWPVTDKRMDKAFMEDLGRLTNLPADTVKELGRLGGNASDGWKSIRPRW